MIGRGFREAFEDYKGRSWPEIFAEISCQPLGFMQIGHLECCRVVCRNKEHCDIPNPLFAKRDRFHANRTFGMLQGCL